MAKFGINDIIDIRSKAPKTEEVSEYKEIWLNPYDVKPADSNFYSQEDIEELADSFLTVGQQQPTVLAKINGEFYIVSGHRRNLANIKNIERGYEKYKNVRYLYRDMTPSMFELSLLVGNAYNRELTAWEKTQQAKRLKEALLRAKKEDGLEIKGKMRDIIANLMNESSSNIAKMDSINHNAVQEIQDGLKNGIIGISAAYEAAKLPHKEQKEIANKAASGKVIPVKNISVSSEEKKVKKSGKNKETVKSIKSKKLMESDESEAEHKKILQKWSEMDIETLTPGAKNAIQKVFESNTPKKDWTDTDWTAFTAKTIMQRADLVSRKDLYLLHDILVRCRENI